MTYMLGTGPYYHSIIGERLKSEACDMWLGISSKVVRVGRLPCQFRANTFPDPGNTLRLQLPTPYKYSTCMIDSMFHTCRGHLSAR